MHQLGVFRYMYFQNTSDEKFYVVCLQNGMDVGHASTEDIAKMCAFIHVNACWFKKHCLKNYLGQALGTQRKNQVESVLSLSLHSVQDKQTGHCEVGARWEESAVSGMGRDVDRGFLAQTWAVSDGSLVVVLELRLSYERKFTTSHMDDWIIHIVMKRKEADPQRKNGHCLSKEL